jgi:hypothetical protein
VNAEMPRSVVEVAVEGIDVGTLVIEDLFGHRDDRKVIATGITLEIPGIQVVSRVITMIFYTSLSTIKNDLAEAAIWGYFKNGTHGGHEVIFFFHFYLGFIIYNTEAEINHQINLVCLGRKWTIYS